MKNPIAVSDVVPKIHKAGDYDIIHIFSIQTGFTVSLRVWENGKFEFDTLIKGITDQQFY